jgi:hypothetical protein
MVRPLRIILHLSHLGLTDARTLIFSLRYATIDVAPAVRGAPPNEYRLLEPVRDPPSREVVR